ncbi:MAG TPA: hypothetical protein PLD20_34475 [Blastocatellia bacterium]|nr:hypothetical protein [Blastocatellia bacterium]HMV86327.1 hypothetical protein [Blastocatellia bacterium]HMX29291.1 hypothetical protein [Blastocatellia bacterium]HMY72312.1 hypothetical protein [Blastocatellia bacterium]HMZ23081.1 hypothetical protein [Blastocatellia bacterium]
MDTQVVLNLPEDTYQRAAQFAAYSRRDLTEVIASTLATALPSSNVINQIIEIAKLPDREVLALTKLRMEPAADRRLSALLDRQQAGELDERTRAELAGLMRIYEINLLRQSQALAEAVERKLIPPLEP